MTNDMSYKYVIKQGGTQVHSATTENKEFSYDFPINTGDTDITYTVDATDNDGCTATTSMIVPSGSACQNEDCYIDFTSKYYDGSFNGGDLEGLTLSFTFEDCGVKTKLIDYSMSIDYGRTYRYYLPKGCSFDKLLSIDIVSVPNNTTLEQSTSVDMPDVCGRAIFIWTKQIIPCKAHIGPWFDESSDGCIGSKIGFHYGGSFEIYYPSTSQEYGFTLYEEITVHQPFICKTNSPSLPELKGEISHKVPIVYDVLNQNRKLYEFEGDYIAPFQCTFVNNELKPENIKLSNFEYDDIYVTTTENSSTVYSPILL